MNISTKYILILSLVAFCLSSCKEEKKEEIIIIKSEKTTTATKPRSNIAMESQHTDMSVEWGGSNMNVVIDRSVDSTLTKIKEEGIDGDTYFDNRIRLNIKRADGSEFFNQTFTKERFKEFVGKDQLKNYAMLTIIFHETTANTMDFVVGVGEPNEYSDNFVNILLSINKQGGIALKPFVIDETANATDDECLEP